MQTRIPDFSSRSEILFIGGNTLPRQPVPRRCDPRARIEKIGRIQLVRFVEYKHLCIGATQ
jgi:hypothetical protein